MRQPVIPATVERARTLLGYRSHPNRESVIGRATGYSGQPWAGSFVNEVLREEGFLETSLVSTTAALGFFAARDRLFLDRPEPGDLVFYAFPSTGLFDQPHVGLVTETVHFKATGTFHAVEGETASGLNRGSQDRDGVFERERYAPDVAAFVRPRAARPVDLTGIPEDVPTLRPTNFSKRSPLRTESTVALQYALFHTTGFDRFVQGQWDSLTRSAFNQFLRTAGLYDEVGEYPTAEQLQVLADVTENRYFRSEE